MSDAFFMEWRQRRRREDKAAKKRRVKPKRSPPKPKTEPEAFARVSWLKQNISEKADLSSAKAGELLVGTRVRVQDSVTLPCGTKRVQVALESPSAAFKQSATALVGWVSLNNENGACALLPISEKAQRGLKPDGDVAKWLNGLKEGRRVLEEAFWLHLSSEQFRVLRMRGTEEPNTGLYTDTFAAGSYSCAGCSKPLYSSAHKFKHACGWASFCGQYPTALQRVPGRILGGLPDTKKVEILCSSCGGHVGHIFKASSHPGGSQERHCVNSASIVFSPSPEGFASYEEAHAAALIPALVAPPATEPPEDPELSA